MEELEKLQKIGAREISKHTHIALNRIQNILDCNFKELRDKTITQGLIQILEREYNISLQKWHEEYNQFWENYEITEEEMSPLVNFKVTHEITSANNPKRTIIIGTVIVLVGIVAFVITNFYPNLIFDSNPDEKTTKKTAQTKVAQAQPPTQSKEQPEISTQEGNATSTNLQPLEIPSTTESLDASASAPLSSPEINSNFTEQSAEEKLSQESQQEPQTTQEQTTQTTQESQVEITPLENVWVGIVYLDTGRRESFMTTQAFQINLKRPQTIVLGHGMLDINQSGEKSNYNDAKKMLFMVDRNGNFTKITQAQYNEYTRGLGW